MKNTWAWVVVTGFISVGSLAHAATATPSVTGANIPRLSQIVDSSSHVWTLASGKVLKDGAAAGMSGDVILLLYSQGVIYQENSAKKFWSWTGTAWKGPVADPRTVSPSQTAIPGVSQIVDDSLNIWAVSGGVVYENGAKAGFSGGVTSLLYYGGKIYQVNDVHSFYIWSGTSWASSSSPYPARVAMDDLEVFEPFPSWDNAKTTYGAVGDGKADDTAALQKALNAIGRTGGPVLFIPAGTYKITSTLTLTGIGGNGGGGLSVVGDSPSTTKIVWAGPAGGNMLILNGGNNYSFSRMTFDGGTTANIGLAAWWNTNTAGTAAGDGAEVSDMVFQDMYIGVNAGRQGHGYGQLDSEGRIRRTTFLRMGYAGVDVGSWNALDWWIWDSQFIDCARGLSNLYSATSSNGVEGVTTGAGALYGYRNYFQGSTVADMDLYNTGWFSMHQNVSIGSKKFFNGGGGTNSAQVILEGNRIIASAANPYSIDGASLGPLILIDNQIQSSAGYTGPVIELNDPAAGTDAISIANKYTVPTTGLYKYTSSTDRMASVADTTVTRASISAAVPTMPATPARVSRRVYEVAAGSTSAQIQTAINNAVAAEKAGAVNPVVHLAAGVYLLTETLVIPAKARVQLVGDSWSTSLQWRGPSGGTMIDLPGPSYATLRNFYLFADNLSAKGITIEQADQPGGRIFIESSRSGPLTASNLNYTQISAQANTGFSSTTLSGVNNYVSMGAGSVGLFNSTGNSNAIVSDTWYEGTQSALYRADSGNLTVIGSQLNPATHTPAVTPIVPAILLDGFKGMAAFVGFSINLTEVPNKVGFEIGSENASTNILALGIDANEPGFYKRTSAGGNVGMVSSRAADPVTLHSTQVPNSGTTDTAFVLKMLAQVRGLVWDTAPYVAPAGATDVRIFRVNFVVSTGINITGN